MKFFQALLSHCLLILLILLYFAVPLQAISKNTLFKEYYIGMSITDVASMKKINVIEDAVGEKIKRFSANDEYFAKSYWRTIITFHKEKLLNVELSLESSHKIQSTHIMSELNKNNFVSVMLCTKRNTFDSVSIFKKLERYEAERHIMNGLNVANTERFYIQVYVEKEVYNKMGAKTKKINNFFELMKKYPHDKRVVIVQNHENSYVVTFATSFEALLSIHGHLKVLDSVNNLKSF